VRLHVEQPDYDHQDQWVLHSLLILITHLFHAGMPNSGSADYRITWQSGPDPEYLEDGTDLDITSNGGQLIEAHDLPGRA
jgi:hypothetical protein